MEDRVKDEVARRLRHTRRAQVAVLAGAVVLTGSAFLLHDGSSPAPDRLLSADPTEAPAPAPSRSYPPCKGVPSSCADGRPGWGTGFTGCGNGGPVAELPVRKEIAEGVFAELVVPESVRSGPAATVVLRVTNSSQRTVSIGLPAGDTSYVHLYGDGVGSALRSSDAMGVGSGGLAAGAAREQSYALSTTSCGDAPEDPYLPLPAGEYAVGLSLRVGVDGVDTVLELADRMTLT